MSSPDQTVYAVLPSVESRIVEYNIEILAVLALVWAIALFAIWIFALRRKREVRYD
jgi:hypothetical protein